MKKHYNPFKMWGSYVGAVILPILTYMFWIAIVKEHAVGGLVVLGSIPIGFLIGWGIHSIIRKIRK